MVSYCKYQHFVHIGLFNLDSHVGPKLDPETPPKMDPKSSPRGFELEVENCSNFEVDFELNLAPTWLQLGTQKVCIWGLWGAYVGIFWLSGPRTRF